MGIEFFTKEGKGFLPKASVRKPGQIGLNKGCVERYDIKNGEHVLLGYDREKRMVAIRRVKESQQGAKTVIVKGKSGTIAAKAFFDYFEIPYDKGAAFEIKEDKETGFLVFIIGPG
jgi:hypothetical protein